eukprot:m51a1_g14471 hypothetical protein (362) ;mRNA; r:681379-682520
MRSSWRILLALFAAANLAVAAVAFLRGRMAPAPVPSAPLAFALACNGTRDTGHTPVLRPKTANASQLAAVPRRGDPLAAFQAFCAPLIADGPEQLGGLHACVYAADKDVFVSASVIGGGMWEAHGIDTMLRHLRAAGGRGLVVDVGANIGLYTLAAAAEGHHVLAFEASATTAELLWRSVLLNGLAPLVHLWANGLSDAPARAQLAVNDANRGGSHVVAPRSVEDGVELVTLDAVLATLPRELCELPGLFLKADIEGYEPRFFRGAERFMRDTRPPLVLLEVTPGDSRRAGCSVAETLHALQGLGYRTRRMEAEVATPLEPQSASQIAEWLSSIGIASSGLADIELALPGWAPPGSPTCAA